MSDEFVVVKNRKTGGLERLPIEEVDRAVEAGTHEATDQSRVRTKLGDTTLNEPLDTGRAHVEGGLEHVSGAREAAEAFDERQRAAYDTAADTALTFAEGVVDAATLGLLHEHGYEADMRRGEHGAAAFLGQMVGGVASMRLPGVAQVTRAGKATGQAAARAVLGEARAAKAGSIAVKTAEEAGVGAALMGATSVGHQVSDAIIEDRPFSAEAAIHEAGLGALLGGTFGFLEGSFAKALKRGKRADITAQGGFVDPNSPTSRDLVSGVRDGLRGFDEAVEKHAQRLGVLEVLAREGKAPGELVSAHRKALERVQRAQRQLGKIDLDRAMSGVDDKLYDRWRAIRGEYEAELVKLDDMATPELVRAHRMAQNDARLPHRPQEGPLAPTRLGEDEAYPLAVELEGAMNRTRLSTKAARHLDPEGKARSQTRDFQADYERIYGRKWEEPSSVDPESVPGEVTPTSESGTAVAKGRARKGTAPGHAGGATPEGGGKPVASEVDRPGPFTEVGTPPGQEPYRPPVIEHGGRVPEGVAGVERPLRQRWGDHPDLLGNAVHPHDQVLMQDGRILPARSVEQNAADFARFRDKLADTVAPKPDPAGPSPGSAETPTVRTGREPAQPRPEPKSRQGQDAVDAFLDGWHRERNARGGVASPADRAAAMLGSIMERVRQESGGRLDSAAALDLMSQLGFKKAGSTWGDQLDQVYAVRKLARAVADESRGSVSALRKTNRGRILDFIGRRVAGRVGSRVAAKAAGGAMGGAVAGPIGWIMGSMFYNKLFGFAGAVSGAAGRLNTKIVEAAQGLLTNHKATIAARAWRAVSANQPVAYSDAGPIENPVDRIVEIRRVAGNPLALKAYVEDQLGDLALLHPELAQHAVEQTTQRVLQLSLRAPAVYWDRLGRPVSPPAQAMRRFHEFENATHDLDGLLAAVTSGRATQPQLEALRVQHPGVYAKLVSETFADPDRLAKLSRERLRDIERTFGVPLTYGASPAVVYRHLQAWELARAGQQEQGSAEGVTPPSPTPAQAGARAPGN